MTSSKNKKSKIELCHEYYQMVLPHHLLCNHLCDSHKANGSIFVIAVRFGGGSSNDEIVFIDSTQRITLYIFGPKSRLDDTP